MMTRRTARSEKPQYSILPATGDANPPQQNQETYRGRSPPSLSQERQHHIVCHKLTVKGRETPVHQEQVDVAVGSACEQNIPPSAVLQWDRGEYCYPNQSPAECAWPGVPCREQYRLRDRLRSWDRHKQHSHIAQVMRSQLH